MVDGDGQAALHWAARDPSFPPTLMLGLAAAWRGAAAHTKNGGYFPLHYAASNKLPPQLVRILLEAHLAGVHVKKNSGEAPLDYAISHGAPEASVALLRAATEVTSPALSPTRHHDTPFA